MAHALKVGVQWGALISEGEARPGWAVGVAHLVLLLGRERLVVALARSEVEAEQRWKHSLLRNLAWRGSDLQGRGSDCSQVRIFACGDKDSHLQ